VHGAGGLDELTPTGENLVAEVRDGSGAHVHARPAPALDRRRAGDAGRPAVGGDPAQNAAIIRTVFDGERGPARDAVILNAGAALLVGGWSDARRGGIDRAVEAIDCGAAHGHARRLVAFTRRAAAAA
jgi:anthranilate phosphoribosyltransferase